MDNVQWTMDNEGIFLRKMIEIWFVGATLAVARWALVKSYCLTGDRKGRPYEHELKIVHEVDTFIVHCPLSIQITGLSAELQT